MICPYCFSNISSERCSVCKRRVLINGKFKLIFLYKNKQIEAYFETPDAAVQYAIEKIETHHWLKPEDFSLFEKVRKKWVSYLDPYAREFHEIIEEQYV